MKKIPSLILAALLALPAVLTAGKVVEKTATGDPGIQQIDVISFAPDGVLLIGEGRQQRLLAIVTGDTEPVSGDYQEIKGFGAHLAAKMGAQPKDIEILDLAVNPASGRLYLAVRKQDDKSYAIIRANPDGSVENVDLTDVEYAAVPLPSGEKAPPQKVTDLVWAGDRLVAAARCNEEFASKIFAADGPIQHDRPGHIYSAETFHVSHNRWETKAPMSVMIPYEENGKHYIVGAFSCTPVVKYPIDDVQPGAKIKGISMIELGSGNRPLDMFGYKKGEKGSVLTNTFRFHHERKPYGPSPHLAFRFDEQLLGAENVNEEAIHRTKDTEAAEGKIEIAEPFHGVIQMDRLNDDTALALREADQDIDLVAIALP